MNNIEELLSMDVVSRSFKLADMTRGTLTPDALDRVVVADIAALQGASDEQSRKEAALYMDWNGQNNPDYRIRLVQLDPSVAAEATSAMVEDLARIERKDARKHAEYISIIDERRRALLLAGLKAISTGDGSFVTPEKIARYAPGVVPENLPQLCAENPEDVELVREMALLGGRQDEALCLVWEKGLRVMWALADPAQHEEFLVGKPLILFEQNGVPRAVSPDPSVFGQLSPLQNQTDRNLRLQIGKVDGMVAALLTYATTREVPSKAWLDAFSREREKLWHLSGAMDGLQPIESKSKTALYGTIILSDASGMTLLRAIGVDVAGYDPETKTCRARVSETVMETLDQYWGEFTWSLVSMPCDQEASVLFSDGLTGVSPEHLAACQEFLLYKAAAFREEGISQPSLRDGLITGKLRMVDAALRAASRRPEIESLEAPDVKAEPVDQLISPA